MNRIRTALAAALIVATLPAAARAQRTLDVREVRDGVHVVIAPPDGSMLIVRGRNGVVLVDALSPELAERADSVVRAVTGQPARWVVNTHYHADHMGANGRFAAAGARLIAHRAVPALAARDTTIATLQWDLEPADPASIPDSLVDASIRIELGTETASVHPLVKAHTGGDLVVKLERANVLHAGDIVEFGAYPFVDWWAGGSFDGLLTAVDRILGLCDDDTIIIPGHGPPLGRRDVRRYRAMLEQIGARVRQAIRTGESLDALLDEKITAEWDAQHGGEPAGRRFVRLLHLEFTRERTP